MKGKKTGGRKKGTPNKATAVQEHMLAAFDRCAMPGDWDRIARAAITQAIKGRSHLLAAVLPFVARKMPETQEHVDVVSGMSPDQLRKAAENYIKNTAE